ncbi:hypothetical protein, partial [Phocaeicola vulgatus]
ADGKTRKDGKEASPKDNRTGYETQTTELSKVLTPQTQGKNCRRKNRKTVASSSDHTSPPKSDKPKIPNKEMKLSSCLTVVPYSFESFFKENLNRFSYCKAIPISHSNFPPITPEHVAYNQKQFL